MRSDPASERDRVREVAAKYEANGYQVILEPGAADLPDFLGGYRPDFIARLGKDTVLVEVKPAASSETMERYRELAETVHARPGWRLDLVLGGQPDSLLLPGPLPVMSAENVTRRYQEAERLLQDGHHEAALLIAWAATEAALRLLAERNAVTYQRSNTPTLLKQLVSQGILDRARYQELWDSYKGRSALAHGFVSKEESTSAQSVIRLGREVLAEVQRAA